MGSAVAPAKPPWWADRSGGAVSEARLGRGARGRAQPQPGSRVCLLLCAVASFAVRPGRAVLNFTNPGGEHLSALQRQLPSLFFRLLALGAGACIVYLAMMYGYVSTTAAPHAAAVAVGIAMTMQVAALGVQADRFTLFGRWGSDTPSLVGSAPPPPHPTPPPSARACAHQRTHRHHLYRCCRGRLWP